MYMYSAVVTHVHNKGWGQTLHLIFISAGDTFSSEAWCDNAQSDWSAQYVMCS